MEKTNSKIEVEVEREAQAVIEVEARVVIEVDQLLALRLPLMNEKDLYQSMVSPDEELLHPDRKTNLDVTCT